MGKLYIAYGSNMDESQMAYRCPEACVVGTGMVEGYHLLFKGGREYAYATIEPEETSQVPVLVWEISDRDENRLNRYEGYPKFYYKKKIPVLANGEYTDAMVYIMDESNPLNRPSQQYHQILAAAYQKYGFDETVLIRALQESCQKDSTVKQISDKELLRRKQKFHKGCRVELEQMDDPQAPPIGTIGTVLGVDSIGNILVEWDNGCGLNVAFGADRCRKI